MWTPAVVERIAAHLPPNEVPCVLRLVNKDTAHQLSDRDSVQLSLQMPRGIFVAQQQKLAKACWSLNREQREKLLCLTASSGDVANLEVALAAAGLESGRNGEDEGTLYVALKAAARACQLDCCRLLAASLDVPLTKVAEFILPAAAARGDMALCRWAWEVCPELAHDDGALCSAAGAGQRAVCEACLALLPDGSTTRRKAAAKAALCAAEGGHTDLLGWFLSLYPAPWCDPAKQPQPCPTRLLVAAAKGCDAATLQRLWAQHGGAGALGPQAWGDVLGAAVASGTPDWAAKAEWALQRGAEAHAWLCYKAAASLPDAVARFGWLRDHGLPPNSSPRREWALAGASPFAPLCDAMVAGNVEAVEWLLRQGVTPSRPGTSDHALWSVQLAACVKGGAAYLSALKQAGCRINLGDVAFDAAAKGYVPILEWVHENQEEDQPPIWPSSADLQYAAACSGSERVVTWLRERGCEPEPDAWRGAVQGGCEAVLELLHEWQVPKPTDGRVYAQAANVGDLRILRALQRLGFSFGPRAGPDAVFCGAVRCSPLGALQWLVAAGCPVDWEAAAEAAEDEGEGDDSDQEDERVLPWIQEQRQQQCRFRIQRAGAHGGGVWTGGGGGGTGRGSGRRGGAKRPR